MVGAVYINITRYQRIARLPQAPRGARFACVALLLSGAKQEETLTLSLSNYTGAIFLEIVVTDTNCNETKET